MRKTRLATTDIHNHINPRKAKGMTKLLLLVVLLWGMISFFGQGQSFRYGNSTPQQQVVQKTKTTKYVAHEIPESTVESLLPLPSIPPFNENDNDVEHFFKYYKQMCLYMAIKNKISEKGMCPCIPKHIIGEMNVTKSATSVEYLTAAHPELLPGGVWAPADCIARQRVAVIIPFRDRHDNLTILLKYLHPMLQRQELYYQIFVVEQMGTRIFNKGILMNAGFVEAMKVHKFDCIIFHDADLLPEDDRNFYTCTKYVRHLTPFIEKFDYRIFYGRIFGGGVSFTPEQFRLVNGYSVKYYGWGGEDDDMRYRVDWKKLYPIRYPKSVCRYKSIVHQRDPLNPGESIQKRDLLYGEVGKHDRNGLNTLKYQRMDIRYLHLYTWILIDVPPKPISSVRS